MSPASSRTRHALYVTAAVLTAAMAGIDNVDFSQPKQVATYLISVALAGVVTSRAYIDQSPALVTADSQLIPGDLVIRTEKILPAVQIVTKNTDEEV